MITIYGKTNCPSCTLAKNILDAKGVGYEYKQLDVDFNVDELVDLCSDLGIGFLRSFPLIVALDQQLSIEELKTL